MKLFKINFSRHIILCNATVNMMKTFGAKIFYCTAILLLCGNTFFSRASAPLLEHRIINLQYDPNSKIGPAIVFDLQIRAGDHYIASGYPMISSEIMIRYDLESGISIDLSAARGTLPIPNPVNITAIQPMPYAFPILYPNAMRIHIDRFYAPSNPMSKNFTNDFVTVGTISIPVLSGTPASVSLTFILCDGTPFTTSWSTGTSDGQGMPFAYASSLPAEFYADEKDDSYNDVNNDVSALGIKFKIYPNPARSGSKVTLQLKSWNYDILDATACIFDMTGKIIDMYHLTNCLTEIAVDFAPGSYMVKVNMKNGKEFVEKVIIQK